MLSLLFSLSSRRLSLSLAESNDSNFSLCFLKIEVFLMLIFRKTLADVKVAPRPSDRARSSLGSSDEHYDKKFIMAVPTRSFRLVSAALGEPGGVVFCRLTPLSWARAREYFADDPTDREGEGWRNIVTSYVSASVGVKSTASSSSCS